MKEISKMMCIVVNTMDAALQPASGSSVMGPSQVILAH